MKKKVPLASKKAIFVFQKLKKSIAEEKKYLDEQEKAIDILISELKKNPETSQ